MTRWVAELALLLLQRGADDVRWVAPHQLRTNAFGADPRGIEQIADFVVELTRLLVDRLDQLARLTVVLDCRKPLEHAATAEDGRERRAQLVRYAADQRVAQDFGLIVERRLLDRFLGLEMLESQRRFLEQCFDAPRRRVGVFGPAVAEIDGDGAITENLRIDDAHEPGAAAARIDQRRCRRRAARNELAACRRTSSGMAAWACISWSVAISTAW